VVFRLSWNGAALSVDGELTEASLGGPVHTLDLSGAETPTLLNAVFEALTAEPELPATVTRFLDALRALGLLVPDAPRVATDALLALRRDGVAYIGPRIRTAIASGPLRPYSDIRSDARPRHHPFDG
jgi:hypothetical protein